MGLKRFNQWRFSGGASAEAEMNSENLESLKRARDLIVGVNQQISEKTENQYRRSFARMQDAGKTPETMATTPNGFYYYRAAWVHHYASEISAALIKAKAENTNRVLDIQELRVKLDALVVELLRYPPDPLGHRFANNVPGKWKQLSSQQPTAGGRAKNHSKRARLKGLPQDWREQMFDGLQVESKYRDVVAVLSATGARPEEFAKGIQVSVVDSDALSFEILGAKTHQGKYGQERRSFIVKADRKELAYLYKRVSDSGGGLRVEAEAGALSDKIRQLSKKVFPKLRSPISAYVFRNQFSADLKASSLSGSEVSVALGHSVDETKSYYGAAQSARSAGGVGDVQGSRQVMDRTEERIRSLVEGSSSTRERQRER